MGFFASNKVKKISSRLDTNSASNVFSLSGQKERNSFEGDLQYGSQNTFRNIEFHKQNRKEEHIDLLMDPLDNLW